MLLVARSAEPLRDLSRELGARADTCAADAALLLTRSTNRRNVTGEIGSGGSNEFYFKTFSGDVRIR